MCATTDLALDRLTLRASICRPRQHGVLTGHPTFTGALPPARYALGHAGRDEHPSVSVLDQHRALGLTQPAASEAYVSKLIVAAAITPHVCTLFPDRRSPRDGLPIDQVAPGLASAIGPL